MRSSTPKVLHEVGGRSLLGHVAAQRARPRPPSTCSSSSGTAATPVVAELASVDPRRAAGRPARAARHGRRGAPRAGGAPGRRLTARVIVVVRATRPLLTADDPGRSGRRPLESGAAATVLTAVVDDPTGYGRVVRRDDGVGRRRSSRTATPTPTSARSPRSTAASTPSTPAPLARRWAALGTANSQGEEYLTDVVALLRADGRRDGLHASRDPVEVLGVNDRVQLAAVGAHLRDRVARRVDARRRHRRRPGDDLGRRHRGPRHRRHAAARAPSCTGPRRSARARRIGPDSTLRDVVVGERAIVVRSHGRGRRGRRRGDRRAVRLPAPGHQPRRRRADRRLRRDQERADRRRLEGAPPVLRRRRRDRRGHQHRGRHGLRELRRRRQAPHRRRRPRAHRQRHHARRSGDDRRRRLHGRRLGHQQDVPPGAMGVARARQRTIEGWVARRRAGTPAAAAAARALEGAQSEAGTPAGEPTEPSDATSTPPTDSTEGQNA